MNTGDKQEKTGIRDEKGRIKPGKTLNPNGRPKSRRNYANVYADALEDIGKENNMTPEQLENLLIKVAFKKAKDGDYQFYRDIMDRVHGKPIQPSEISGKDGHPIVFMPSEMIDKYKLDDTDTDSEHSGEGQAPVPGN